MNSIFRLYKNAFGGLSRPAWMLAIVMFINRSGAMVIPFLSLYLTEELGFSLKETGFVLSMFGLGAMGGAFIGGWLTDRIGHFWVQVFSLVGGGMLFFFLVELRELAFFAAGIFILSLVTECLRPANSSSVSYYARPENVTRAFSLNRMAINLGFSIGPALGGVLAGLSYRWLFIADGSTCIAAGIFFYFYFRSRRGYQPVKREKHVEERILKERSPYTDMPFLLFALLCSCFTIIFFQFFSTLPLYYRQVYGLSEGNIGGLLALNGLIVFLLEMLVVYLLGDRLPKTVLIISGMLMVGFSFSILNLVEHVGILYLSMLLLSIAEILAMPFMATITVQRSNDRNRGAYMGLYTISFSGAHALAPFLGTSIIDKYSFNVLWWAMGVASVLTAIGFYWVVQRMERERLQTAHSALSIP